MNVRTKLTVKALIVCAIAAMAFGADWKTKYFPSFADEHTVGLWLFDETDYPYTTLTDAGQYEYDLRLMKGGKLVPGRFGNALKLTPGRDYAVSYAAWKGAVGFNNMREMSGRPGSGLFGPTIAPETIVKTFADRDFTCEFWLLLMSNPIQDVVIIDFGDKLEPGFTVRLKTRAAGLIVENAYGGFKAVCPTRLNQLWGRAWHHVAFTYSAGSDKLRCFIDGRVQEPVKVSRIAKSRLPASVRPDSIADTTYGIFEKEDRRDVPDYEKRIRHRFNFAIGHDRRGEHDFNGNLDELRFSDVTRYKADFPLPDSFSRNYRKGAPGPAVSNGPPLLFSPDKSYLPNEPVMLGSRKHVFIDEVMVDRKRNIKLTLNRPGDAVQISERAAWDASFFEHEGKIYTVVSEGYEGDEGPINLLVSEDGVKFAKPNLGLIEYEGSKNNNLIMLGLPSWGKYFKDTNPACPAEELFKATLWVGQRGIYLYFSPDAVHWRRNETCMLPLVSGGGCETFWDDQQGCYFNYIKRDGSYNTGNFPNYGRSTTMFKTREINKTWPFNHVPNPYFEGWPFPAVTGEGITVLGPDIFSPDEGQIFRTRPQKYEWAPDTYVAFMIRGGCDMAVSRDAVNWNICSENGLGYYWDTAVANGMIRRGAQIWQWANYGEGEQITTVRLSQRLDGFISLDAGEQNGIVITRPFIFEGDRLVLNVDAKAGRVKVAIVALHGKEYTGYNVALTNPAKKPVRGFGIADCDPIRADSVRHVVTWKGDPDVGNLAGQVVRLRFEMENAKLYAFQFVDKD
ncbi:MAG: LamG-like jellyroll fold domain-containing protein [Planctomycetota bacterium]